MIISGESLIGRASRRGGGGTFEAIEAATGRAFGPPFSCAGRAELDEACKLAAESFDAYRNTALDIRADFLEAIAQEILESGDDLIVRCMRETGLPRGRLEGERGRTVAQLRMFASVTRDGGFLRARIDPAESERMPARRPDLRLQMIGIGPVAVFGASNFPFAFSVAGGDTASALAAGCPVVVKAHPAHPGTSELVGRAVQAAATACGMPEGVFSLLFDSGIETGAALVADPRIAAVGFTGSRGGGTALMRIAAGREVPIPVYAEMSSINPVVLFRQALLARGAEIGRAFVSSLILGSGQFCTSPGLLLAEDGAGLDAFVAAAAAELADAAAATMLTPGIHHAYCSGVDALASNAAVKTVARGRSGDVHQGQAGLFETTAEAFLSDRHLGEEVFGAASLLVRCRDAADIRAVIGHLEGQLTASLHMDPADYEEARSLLPVLERKVGRILVNGFGTGVEVGHAMVHGGPYPATSDSRTTSVGSLAIDRFLRPVSYQDMPGALLPDALRDENPLGLWRRLDGKLCAP
ncbi:aldehyde dehydrogenase (NADP(+)) [Enterovirga sp.]|uniref:aldehyde dehydrogenase (NADP(+)) n=1 Tax=Enterovirga sp. TaxID=2026350 RepID=UPI002C74F803|nr:aldehyde dehydrogenase (NADP(+)) [Enterovirga sp.]HMO29640.1 aldehyde dehydrogenase (NADP(+)) [Enterovirga sp.]